MKDGIVKGFYENGQLTYRRTYKEGKLDGLWEIFHENGQVSFTGYYENDKEVGVWRFFDEKGEFSPQETLGWTLEITIKSNKEKEKKKNGIKKHTQ